MQKPYNITVIGLGYVGLPLAVALAKHHKVKGFDISTSRVQEIQNGHDRTLEIDSPRLKESRLEVFASPESIAADIYIVTVPTPINEDTRKPDLEPLKKASALLGSVIKKGDIVVFESTVYPGVTEDICGKILSEISGLKAGDEFFLGYSPERINPGDKVHTVDKITKVVAGQTPEITNILANLYGSMNNHNIFKAATIKAAEAAKVIENTQRDINIAFMNEIALIFSKMGISIHDVLDAAETKWNFLPFKPGMVGGHCIGVDPYYLAEAAKQHKFHPQIILAGREINEAMPENIADMLSTQLKGKIKLLVLGLTFKENVPDLRNSKVFDLIQALKKKGFDVDVHDSYADPAEAKSFYDIDLIPELKGEYDAVIGAVGHNQYLNMMDKDFLPLLKADGTICDLKAIWRNKKFDNYKYWSL